jgi:hypothetical protein
MPVEQEQEPQEPAPEPRPTWAHRFRAVLIVLGSAAAVGFLVWAIVSVGPKAGGSGGAEE